MKLLTFAADGIRLDGRLYPAGYSKSPKTGAITVLFDGPAPDLIASPRWRIVPDAPEYPQAAAAHLASITHAQEAAPQAREEAPRQTVPAPDACPQQDRPQVVENVQLQRLQIVYTGASQAVRDCIAAHGFYFSSVTGAWHKKLTNKARRAAAALFVDLEQIA